MPDIGDHPCVAIWWPLVGSVLPYETALYIDFLVRGNSSLSRPDADRGAQDAGENKI